MADRWYITPLNLSLLYEVFEEACARNQIAPASQAADHLAKVLVTAFENGVQDKGGLMVIAAKQDQTAT